MEKVICFGLCDKNYVDMLKVALHSFYKFNNFKIKIFLVDDSSQIFKREFENFLDKVEFIDFGNDSKTKKYIDKHYDDFKSFNFCFDKSGILNVTLANEITDYMSENYGKLYQVILRLDFDVMFFNNINESIDNFLKSGKKLGGCKESSIFVGIASKILSIKRLDIKTYLNAGNFMYRTDTMLKNQFERMCDLFETIGFEKFHYFDQDTVNIMYKDEDKYDANNDGWIITCIPPSSYFKFIAKKQKPIFIHFVGHTKPFLKNPKKYDHLNFNENKFNIFSGFFPYYLKYAEEANCSKEFIETVKNNYEYYKDWHIDKKFNLIKVSLSLIEKIIYE